MNLTRNSGIFVGRKVVGLTVAAQMVVFIDMYIAYVLLRP
jgi:hypothetical protein